MLRHPHTLVLALAMLLATPLAHAEQHSPSCASAARLVAWKPRAWMPGAMLTDFGLRVAIDPVDGTLGMPSADELTSSATSADRRPVRMTLRPNGSGRAQLDDRFAEFAIVSLGVDGKPVWSCVHGSHGASRFMARSRMAEAAARLSQDAPWADK